MLSLIATWVSALATVGLFLGAAIAAHAAGKTFRLQSKQVDILETRLKDQQALNRQEINVLQLQAQDLQTSIQQKRGAQARRILVWQDHLPQDPNLPQAAVRTAVTGVKPSPVIALYVENASAEPVRFVTISWYRGNRPVGNPEQAIPVLNPNLGQPVEIIKEASSDDLVLWGAVVEFTDAGDIRWSRRAEDGELRECPK